MAFKQPFERLMDQLRTGDQDAAREVFEQFARRLVGLAASRLPDSLNAKVDPEDVVQSVFRTFFRRHGDGQFTLENWDSLWTLLTVLTVRKCGHRLDQFLAARRDIRRERSGSPDGGAPLPDRLPDTKPTPFESILLLETVTEVLRGLKQEDQPIVQMRLEGYSIKEISERIGRSERTVHRALEIVREQLEATASAT